MIKTHDKEQHWAIGQILGNDARTFIYEHYDNEIEEVQVEMRKD